MFTLQDNVLSTVWWTFPIAEVLTSVVAFFLLRSAEHARLDTLEDKKAGKNLVITISREHGTNGKKIGKLVAQKLGILCYDKEEIKEFAVEHHLSEGKSADELYQSFLS